MPTCFMNPNYVRKKEEVISFIVLVVVLLVPVGNFIYGIMQAIYVGRRISFENNKEDKKLFAKYCFYIGIYLFMTFLVILLFIFDFLFKYNNKPFRWYIYLITVFSIGTPFFVAIIRFIQIYVRSDRLANCCCRCCCKKDQETIDNNKKEILTTGNELKSAQTMEFEHFEKMAMKKVKYRIIHIYLLVCIKYICCSLLLS